MGKKKKGDGAEMKSWSYTLHDIEGPEKKGSKTVVLD